MIKTQCTHSVSLFKNIQNLCAKYPYRSPYVYDLNSLKYSRASEQSNLTQLYCGNKIYVVGTYETNYECAIVMARNRLCSLLF